MELGSVWITIARAILDFLCCIPDCKAKGSFFCQFFPDSGFNEKNFKVPESRFPYMGRHFNMTLLTILLLTHGGPLFEAQHGPVLNCILNHFSC